MSIISKKEEVVETARKLFSEYGYTKVTMDEIAEKSKVTKKTIYTYFKDKNDLIKYFLYEEIDKMKKLTDKVRKKNISFEDKVHELIMLQLDYRNTSKLLVAIIRESDKNTVAKECEEIINHAIREELKDMLEEAISDGFIKECDTDIVSFLIYKIYMALIFEVEKPFDENKAIESIMSILKAWLIK